MTEEDSIAHLDGVEAALYDDIILGFNDGHEHYVTFRISS